MKIAIETLGCKLNQAETEELARDFIRAGHEVVGRDENPDVYILNTCTVTQTADSKSRHLLRMVKRRNPQVRVIVTGCYADRAPLELAKLNEVDLVTGNEGKRGLFRRLAEEGYLIAPLKVISLTTTNPAFRTRAFIKIQDGCRNFCAYCIVPYVRRNEQSIPANDIINRVKQRVEEGYQEAVLTGTRIGAYDTDGLKLRDLVASILSETTISRLRLSSLQPREISPELLALWKDRRLCPHFHLSLQSGSAGVLRRMRRRYTLDEYEKTVALIRALVPDVAITTDVIVGFPGETEDEFKESFDFCKQMGFARIHVFPFSPRSGTEAAQMPGQVDEKVKKERSQKMITLAKESMDKFREQFKDTTLDVLWEQQTGSGVWSGITGNYIRVYQKDSKDLVNRVGLAKIK
jgi:threonylcarbamoyladenosine tRNA methylthiotransferase MtaB